MNLWDGNGAFTAHNPETRNDDRLAMVRFS